MKTIPLTQGQVALVDEADFAELSAHKWYAQRTRTGGFYANRSDPTNRGGKIWMHRALLPGVREVDHKNQNKLDNQRENLRPATRAQNLHNRGKNRQNSSGFKGVFSGRGRWRARIAVANHILNLGTFDTAAEAARTYDAEAIKQFGEFACVNFPK